MNELKNIENKIHIANLDITDDMLNLLYEYIVARLETDFSYGNFKLQLDESGLDFKKLIYDRLINCHQ